MTIMIKCSGEKGCYYAVDEKTVIRTGFAASGNDQDPIPLNSISCPRHVFGKGTHRRNENCTGIYCPTHQSIWFYKI